MYFMGGFPTTRKGHEYLLVVVESFSKTCILKTCKKTIKEKEESNMFLE
jgi:hypothetical protein